jgi:hypothetical protein
MRPIRDLTRAVTVPFKALFVVGLCALINAMTSPGHWWFQWVALGMGIAVVVAVAKGLRTAFVLGLLALVGWWIYRRWGAAARDAFADWARRNELPRAADILQRVMSMPPSPVR